MKKLIILMGLGLAVSTATFAQNKKDFDPQKRAEKMSLKQKEELKLDDQQYAKVLKLNTEKANAMHKERMEMQEKRKAEREQYDKSLKGILSKDQYASLEAKRAEHKEKMKGEMKNRKGKKGHMPRKRMNPDNN